MAEEGSGRFPDGGVGKQQQSSLDERLAAAHRVEAERIGTAVHKPDKGSKQGSRVLAELIAGPVGGGLVGWLLDRWLGTSPWLLLVMLFLGIGAAGRSIYRISNERPE